MLLFTRSSPSYLTCHILAVMLSLFMCAGIGSVILALLVYYQYFRVPNGLPYVPTIPAYVSLAGLWADMGNDEIYDRWLRKPLEAHGAVKVWFRGRWSILTTRPDLLSFIFRNEDLYAKAGNFTLLPWTVTAAMVGDNMLGAHGEKWKLMASIIKPGSLKTRHDSKLLLEKSRAFVDLLLNTQAGETHGGVLVDPLIQRFTLAAMGECMLDVDLGVSSNSIADCFFLTDDIDPQSSWTSHR